MKGIGKRVTIGFLSIVALLFVSGMISLFELGNMSNDTEKILSASRRNMEIAKDMLNSASEHSSAVVHIAVFGDKSYADVCRRSIGDLEGKLASARSEAVDASRLDSLAIGIEQLQRVVDEYLASQDRTEQPVVLPAEEQEIVVGEDGGVNIEDLGATTEALSGKAWYDTKYKMAYLDLIERGILAERTYVGVVYHKIVEEFYSRPRRRTVIEGDVVPAEGWRVVHHARAGVDALGDKVGAVPAYTTEVAENRVLPEGVFLGVGDCSFS